MKPDVQSESRSTLRANIFDNKREHCNSEQPKNQLLKLGTGYMQKESVICIH